MSAKGTGLEITNHWLLSRMVPEGVGYVVVVGKEKAIFGAGILVFDEHVRWYLCEIELCIGLWLVSLVWA